MNKKLILGLILYIAIITLITYSNMTANDYDNLRDGYYRAYVVNEQYIGDITVNGYNHTDILLMNVTPIYYAYGKQDLWFEYEYYIFGDLTILDDKYLMPTEKYKTLYFADENEIRQDIQNGDWIYAFWKDIDYKYVIRGINKLY